MNNEQAHPSATGSMDMKRNIILHDNLSSMLSLMLQYKRTNLGIGQFDPRNFDKFSRDFKSYLRSVCEYIGATIVSYEADNFQVSTLVQRKDRLMVRVHLDDVRRAKNFDMILIRSIPRADDELTQSRSTFARVENLGSDISNL